MEDVLNSDEFVLAHDNEMTVSWADTPEAMRHVVDRARLKKLIRNADNVYIPIYDLELTYVKVQKSSLTVRLDRESNELDLFACVFNGLDLRLLGKVHKEEETPEEKKKKKKKKGD